MLIGNHEILFFLDSLHALDETGNHHRQSHCRVEFQDMTWDEKNNSP